jgi:tight adherence protein C
MRVAIGAGLLVWVGATLLLSQWARVSRPGLAERLRPFSPGGAAEPARGGLFSVESLRESLVPWLAKLVTAWPGSSGSRNR